MLAISKFQIIRNSIFIGFLILVVSCSKEEDRADSTQIGSDDKISFELENNLVQKGPFVEGSSILIVELDDNLESTSVSYNTETIDDFGSFNFSRELNTNFVDVITTGFYFNEITGDLSSGQVTLRNFIDASTSTSSNINILTTLSRQRIKYLIKNEGNSYVEARAQAESEVLSTFKIPENIVENIPSFEQLDISKNGDGNAILLAISCILQGENTDGELSELITKFANDLESDGEVEDGFVLDKIAEGSSEIDTLKIKENLEERFSSLGITHEISDFGYFIDADNNGVINGKDVAPLSPIVETTESKPIFQWATSDTEGVTYDLQLATSQRFENLILDFTDLTGNEAESETVLERGQTYFWRVRLVENENVGEWKEQEFQLVDFEITDFILNLNEGENIIPDSKPLYGWSSIPLENIQYEIEIANNADFQGVLFNSGLISTNEIELDYVLPEEGKYYWRVRYVEANGIVSEWFAKENGFEFRLPFIYIDSNLGSICYIHPIIGWYRTPSDSQASLSFEYELQVSLNSDFSEPIFNEQNVNISVDDSSADEYLSHNLEMELQENQVYHYRIRTRDENGIVGGWIDSTFNLEGYSSVDTAAIYPTGTISEIRPLIDWNEPYNIYCEPEEIDYQLQIATDVSFDQNFNPIFNQTVLDVEGLEDSQYQVLFDLETGIDYYYRIRYHDGNGNYSPWSWSVFNVTL